MLFRSGTGTGVTLDAGVHFALDRDPSKQTAGDSRFTLAQLASSEALSALQFNVDGEASATLRGLSLVGGKDASFSIAPDLELALIVPDLTRFDGVTLIESSPTKLARFDGTKSLDRKQVTDLPLSGSFKAGDTLRLEAEVLDTRISSKGKRGYVQFRFSMWREDERVMMFVCWPM